MSIGSGRLPGEPTLSTSRAVKLFPVAVHRLCGREIATGRAYREPNDIRCRTPGIFPNYCERAHAVIPPEPRRTGGVATPYKCTLRGRSRAFRFGAGAAGQGHGRLFTRFFSAFSSALSRFFSRLAWIFGSATGKPGAVGGTDDPRSVRRRSISHCAQRLPR